MQRVTWWEIAARWVGKYNRSSRCWPTNLAESRCDFLGAQFPVCHLRQQASDIVILGDLEFLSSQEARLPRDIHYIGSLV